MISLLLVSSVGAGANTEILERGGGVDQKVGFNRYEEAIKNALKWRKPDISSFISKKVVFFIRKSYLNLKMTNHICFIQKN